MDVRRRKLQFRASRRGFRELDLFMEAYADVHLASLNEQELDEFEVILDLPDQEVYAWVLGRESPPADVLTDTLRNILAFDYAEYCRNRTDT